VSDFLIVTSSDLPEAYFLAAFLLTQAQRCAIVNVSRPAGSRLRVLARQRRTRGLRYALDLMLARLMDAILAPIYRRVAPPGSGAFPEVDARLVREIRGRIPVLDSADPHGEDTLRFAREFAPDYILLAGCPILKPSLYGLARRGALNRHLGMAPEFRGSDCAVWAFATNRPESAGYSIHWVSERVDAGDIIVRRSVPVGDEPSLPHYLRRLRREGSNGFVEVLERVLEGAPLPRLTHDGRGQYYPAAGWSIRRRAVRGYARALQNSREASRAPSARLPILAQTTPGSTAACPTQVPKPQSVPAITRSRPTSRA
jgi:hypothetical protein